MSVEVKGANQMMRSQKTFGSADSGAGVILAGFYAPNGEVDARLKAIDLDQGPFSEIAFNEQEGWTVFVGCGQGSEFSTMSRPKLAFYRREVHKFFDDLPSWLFRTKAVRVHRMSISQSSGFISLTLLYSDNGSV